jgi:putative phosphoesterase
MVTLTKFGLLSDSHGRAAITQRAVGMLRDEGAEMLLHLGDLESEQVIDALLVPSTATGDALPVRLVFGNVDWDMSGLGRYAADLGIHVDHPAGHIDLGDGRMLVFTHGHDARVFNQALAAGAAYLCHGHTHVAADRHEGSTHLINPGALFRTTRPSVALLDTAEDQVRFFDVDRS